jgi:tRNA dimethylallyltransferase
MKQTLHIITGPTAVGKTEYALRYAESHDAEIVSCDASLVYRGMDVGTAKPSAEERTRVPHHLIDLHAVDQPYDIVGYVRDAAAAVADILSRGKSVVVTGGSGFYLKSFFAPVLDDVAVSEDLKAAVAGLYAEQGLSGLLDELRRYSPAGLGNLDTRNPRRVVRALERCRASGKDLPTLQAEFAARPEPYAGHPKYLILLERAADRLQQRVAERAQAMVAAGLIEEVEELLRQGIQGNPSAASAIGYRETIAYLQGELTCGELVPRIVQNTLHLVKKQRTWFRTQLPEPDVFIDLDAC